MVYILFSVIIVIKKHLLNIKKINSKHNKNKAIEQNNHNKSEQHNPVPRS